MKNKRRSARVARRSRVRFFCLKKKKIVDVCPFFLEVLQRGQKQQLCVCVCVCVNVVQSEREGWGAHTRES